MTIFVVSLTYNAPLEDVDKYVPEHVKFLDEHYRSGQFLLSGRKVPRTGGVILAKVENRAVLDRLLEKDPFNREKLASYEVTEIVPTKSSRALAFLVEA